MSYPLLSVLIPAAGGSERLGQPKQLVLHKDRPLICRAVECAMSLAPGEIIVVTGANAALVEEATQKLPVRRIHNPQWSDGMGGSIALGAAAISRESTGLLILLCDQWRVNPQDLQTLASTWQSDPERIAIAEAEGKYMPPVIFPASCFDQLERLEGKHGARTLIEMHPELTTPVQMDNAAFDLDTSAHLKML